MQSGTRNMTSGGIRRLMLSFATPIFLSQLFQQLYNTADSLIVGRLLGKQALAAVSSSSPLLFLFTSLMIGMSQGAGVVISKYFGSKQLDVVSDAIHTAIAFAAVCGAVMTAAGITLSPILLRWMRTAPDVIENSVLYFRNYFYGSMAVMLYNIFTGIMNALGDSRRPLYFLIFSSVLNVLLDILFIAGFHWGVGSAAIATAISQAASALLCLRHFRKPGMFYRVEYRKIRFHPALIREIIKMGLPTGIQNSVIAFANVLVQSNYNTFGSDAMAACGIYSKLEGFAFLPITSFSMALTTFISQNLGAKQYERAKQGANFGIIVSVLLAELIGTVLFAFAPFFARIFIDTEDVIRITVKQCHIETLFYFMLAFSHSVAGICRGAGKATVPMTIMLSVWCVFRILYITVAMSISHDIRLLFLAYPITWSISSVIFWIYFRKSNWVHGFE